MTLENVFSEVICSKSHIDEIREKFPSAKDRAKKRRDDAKAGLVDLVNAPERAAGLIRDAHDKTTRRTPFRTKDSDFLRFITEGARITDGSFVENRDDILKEISRVNLPRNAQSKLIHTLQR